MTQILFVQIATMFQKHYSAVKEDGGGAGI